MGAGQFCRSGWNVSQKATFARGEPATSATLRLFHPACSRSRSFYLFEALGKNSRVGAVFGRADTRTESALRRDLSSGARVSPPTEKRKAGSKPLTDHRYKPRRLPLSRDFVFHLPRPLRSSDPPPPLLGRGENQRLPGLSSSSVPSFLLCHHPSASRALRTEGSLGE